MIHRPQRKKSPTWTFHPFLLERLSWVCLKGVFSVTFDLQAKSQTMLQQALFELRLHWRQSKIANLAYRQLTAKVTLHNIQYTIVIHICAIASEVVWNDSSKTKQSLLVAQDRWSRKRIETNPLDILCRQKLYCSKNMQVYKLQSQSRICDPFKRPDRLESMEDLGS